jgi:NAD(P)H-dependent FMN reductase
MSAAAHPRSHSFSQELLQAAAALLNRYGSKKGRNCDHREPDPVGDVLHELAKNKRTDHSTDIETP